MHPLSSTVYKTLWSPTRRRYSPRPLSLLTPLGLGLSSNKRILLLMRACTSAGSLLMSLSAAGTIETSYLTVYAPAFSFLRGTLRKAWRVLPGAAG